MSNKNFNIYKPFGGRKAFFVLLVIVIWIITLLIDTALFLALHKGILLFIASYLGINVSQKYFNGDKK